MKIFAAIAFSLSLWTHIQAAVPGAPALQNPAAGAEFQPVNPTLSWTAVTGAVSYHVQVATGSDFDPRVKNDSGITQAYWNLTGLQNNTAYYWRVRAKNADGVGEWSAARTFTTLPAAPPAVTLASPADAAANVALKPTLIWRKQASADDYLLQVSTRSDFNTTVVSTGFLTDTTYAVPADLANGTTYYWRVQAHNEGGTGTSSPVWSFGTLPTAPAVPGLMAPADDAAQLPLPVAFSWHKADRAAAYTLQISTASNFQTLVLDSALARGDTVCSYAKLNYAGTYYWRVRATNAGGNSAYSSTRDFSTLEKPALPALMSPADFALDLPNTGNKLVWHKSSRATLYHVQVSAKADFSTLAVNDSGADTTRTLGNLAYGAYFWRVEAKNAAGTSGFTAVWHFSTQQPQPAAAPALVSPANAATGVILNPVLTWRPAARAALYRIQVSTVANFASFVDRDSTRTDTARTVGPLLAEQTYYWRVQAVNGDGDGEYSEVRSFTTRAGAVGKVTLVAPADDAKLTLGAGMILVWKPAPGAARYRVQISGTADFAARLVDDSAVTDTVKAILQLQDGKTYYWRVAAINSAGIGEYSDARKFTLNAIVATGPALLKPADGAADLERPVVLVWSPIASATQYRVEVAKSPTFATLVLKDTLGRDTTDALRSLEAGTTYYWRVQAFSAAGPGPYSEIRGFSTRSAVGLSRDRVSAHERISLTAGPAGAMLDLFVPRQEKVAVDLIEPGTGKTYRLIDRALPAGIHRFAAPLPPTAGVYVMRLASGSYRETKRVVFP